MSAGRVGRPHGRDGSFYVDGADHPLPTGTPVVVAGEERRVLRRAGTEERPLISLSGVSDRAGVSLLHGEPLLLEQELADDEWLADDLVGCDLPGLGTVRRVLQGPSCDLLELADGRLVPFVADAIRSIDTERRMIEVDHGFLGDGS